MSNLESPEETRQAGTAESVKLLTEALGSTARSIDPVLHAYTSGSPKVVKTLVSHALAPQGQRERPLLVRLGCELVGGDFGKVFPAAAAMEFFHFSTLVSDDIIDESKLRGSMPTVSHKFGASRALLTAEILEGLSYKALLDLEEAEQEIAKRVPAAIAVLLETHQKLYLGQLLDLEQERDFAVSEEMYYEMISLTTASLISASVGVGVVLGGGTSDDLHSAMQFGENLGLAMQIRDDVAELIADFDVIGKQLGGDIIQGKMRLPMIAALNSASEADRNTLTAALSMEELTEDKLSECVTIILRSDAIQYSQDAASRLCKKAIGSLDHWTDSSAKQCLTSFADVVGNCW